MSKSLLTFPNHLFADRINPEDYKKIYIIEEDRYFTDYNFHKQKLVLHRASMKKFQEKFEHQKTEYINYKENLKNVLKEEKNFETFKIVDKKLKSKIKKLESILDINISYRENPMFLNSMEWNKKVLNSQKGYFHHEYYKKSRKKHGILLNQDGGPEGDKWSFDQENRKKLPQDVEIPDFPGFGDNKYVEEAKKYVEKNFEDNPGSLENFLYPISRNEAIKNLENFLDERLEKFGPYQDAIDKRIKIGFHSLLSSSLNIGLLTPDEVIEKTLESKEKNELPIQSVEGFIRQIIGWREYIRGLYEIEGEQMKNSNYWNLENNVPEEFYKAETGIPPLDTTLKKALKTGYCHHIERLMVLGNFLLLIETDPNKVNKWFMEMFIDSFEWVMVPNVYGMSQYAYTDMMTKPYISSSNYIKKMSHFEEGEWCEKWDGLYWRFIKKNRKEIENISRMAVMTSHLERMSDEKLETHVENAKNTIETLNN